MSLPSGFCPVPVDITNANISSGKQEAGSVRSYTCNHGYLDTSLDSTTDVTTCMTDGEWSKVQLNCSGPYIRIETPYTPHYSVTPISAETLRAITGDKSNIIFLARICRDITFELTTPANNGRSYTYKVIIGGWHNTKSVIVSLGRKAEHNERNIASCKEFRALWLSWENGTISVGKGRIPGDKMFLKWTPHVFTTVNNVGVSSFKNNAGTWLFIPRI